VSPITGLPFVNFWVNVDHVEITSAGPFFAPNGLLSVNGATALLPATALTRVTMLGDNAFVLGAEGSGQAGLAFTAPGLAQVGNNTLDLELFSGHFYNIGDPGAFDSITSKGGLLISMGKGNLDGIYTPAPGFTGGQQVGGQVTVGGGLYINMRAGTVQNQTMMVLGGPITVDGGGGAGGGLLDSHMTTLGGSQVYNGFDGGLTGSITTNGGFLLIGPLFRVNGVIHETISTGIGQAIVNGGNGPVTLDFSGAGTTGFHKALNGPDTEDRFFGGTSVNTLIIDPMINNLSSPNGEGLATGVHNITLQSPAGTPWGGTAGGTGGVLPTNTVDLGLLNRTGDLLAIATSFPQTIRINGPLTGAGTGQTFKDAVSGDTFVLDNFATAAPGGSMRGQVMAFDFALPTASNVLSVTVENINTRGGAPLLTLRDFEISSAAASQQNPVTTLNLQTNSAAGAETHNQLVLDNLNRLATLNMTGTANRFNQTATILTIGAVGGTGALTTIAGGDQNYSIAALAAAYMSAVGGTITLGNGINTIAANAGDWTITSGLVPGGGTAGDSGTNFVYLSPQLGNLHVVRTGGGNDFLTVGFNLLPGGGRVDVSSGAGNDYFLWNQAGVFPALNSAQKVDAGEGYDIFELAGGAINENDSLFGQITNTEEFRFALGNFDNSLLLNFFANGSGLQTIVTAGFGSSNVIFEGTGFTNRMRYQIATQLDGGGDFGHDAIIVAALPSGTNAITVASTSGGYNIAFQTGLMTDATNPGTGLITQSGIFANPFAANTLELTADNTTANVFQLGGFGTLAMRTIIGKSGGVGAGVTVWLVNDPALGTGVTRVDLGEVNGNTTVYANGSTLRETIVGGTGVGFGNINTLFGGLAADTITAMGTAVGFGTNFIWGGGDITGGAQDVLTGVAGGAGNNVGTVFYIDSVADSPGGPFDPAFNLTDVHITNFHSDTDTLLINPAALALGDVPGILGEAATYADALALLAGGGAAQTQAVYQLDAKALWIDANNDGLLNQLDIRVFVDFGSPGFNPGSVNLGNLLGLFSGADVTGYIDPILNPFHNVDFSGVLLPGEWLFGGGPGNNDQLTLLGNFITGLGGNVADGILVGFEHLHIPSLSSGTLSIRQWNDFYPSITGAGDFSRVVFLDGLAPLEHELTILSQVGNYDFSEIATPVGGVGTTGITVSTEDFLGVGWPMQTGNFLLATRFDDTFNVDEDDLLNAMEINGNDGHDTLNVDVDLVFGDTFGQNPAYPAAGSGVTDAVVLNVETLNLLDGFNQVGFNPGTQFINVLGGAFQDIIANPQNLDPGWFLDIEGGSGLLDTNIIEVTGAANDLSAGTILATGGFVALDIGTIGGVNPSNTTMTFQQYTLFEASSIGPLLGIFVTGGSTFGNTTITFSNQVTGTVLDDDVGKWVFSSADDTFTLGDVDQGIDVSSGGADTAILNIPSLPIFFIPYAGKWVGGSADDTVVLAANVSITGVNGGAATTFGLLSFDDRNLAVSMTLAQHNGFLQPFLATGTLATPSTQTITLTTSGTATGDSGIEQYHLASGNDVFTVAPNNGALTGGVQNVNVASGGAGGKMNGVGADDTYRFIANGSDVDIAGLINTGGAAGGVTGAGTFDFTNADITVGMTVAQHNGPPAPTFINAANTQTIDLTTAGTVTGNASIEQYVLTGGAGNANTFTVAPNSGSLSSGKQNVTVTAGGAQDTIRFGTGTFTGSLLGLLAADGDIVQFFENLSNVNIRGVNGGDATGASTADFSDVHGIVTMTFAQHNGFAQPFLRTAGNQTIRLFDSGIASGDAGIDTYFLNVNGVPADDVFTIAKDDGVFEQSVDFGDGNDIAVFGTGTFTGNMSAIGAGDTTKFAGDADIKGVNSGFSIMDKVDFDDLDVSVTMTLAQHNGFTQPFAKTAGTQTITLSKSGTATGDGGIEQYVLANGNDTFAVGAVGQNVSIASGGLDTIVYGAGAWTGALAGAVADDTVKFSGNADISGVNSGSPTGAGTFDFGDANLHVSMTLAQHEQPGTFGNTANTQTITLATSGTATGDGGIEQYILASGDDVFTVAPNGGTLVGGVQNVDISSGGADVLVFGSPFSGKMNGVAADDTYRFIANGSDVDISKLINNTGVAGGVTGAGTFDFTNADVHVIMTIEQHNIDGTGTPPNFIGTGAVGVNVQTITLTTNGTATGNAGIEEYVLGEALPTSPNVFTMGVITQSVTGRGANDTVIDPFGGTTGVLQGGDNTATGDTLILQGANTTLPAGSFGFENLILTVVNGTLRTDTLAHNGFTGVIDAPGINTYTVAASSGGTLTGLAQFENYSFVSAAIGFKFTLTDAQTGAIDGSLAADTFTAMAGQVAGTIEIDGNGGNDTLNVTSDAAGLNLDSRTSGIEIYNLQSGSTDNVLGAHGDDIVVNAFGSTIFTMGAVGANQTYNGGSGLDDVTFNVGSTTVMTNSGGDIVRSLVGGAITKTLDGGDGVDTLSLSTGDDLSGGTVIRFEDLVLASGASVKMTGTQYTQFATISAAPGINTVTIAPGTDFSGTTFAGVENYVLLNRPVGGTYTVAASDQTVTDAAAAGLFVFAHIKGGLDNVTLAATANALTYDVIALGGSSDLDVTLLASNPTVSLGGGHEGINVALEASSAFSKLTVAGAVSGALDGGAGPGADQLSLEDSADIGNAIVTGFETLFIQAGAMAMSAATWDQFVGPDGLPAPGHAILDLGVQTVTLTTTTLASTAYSQGVDRVENYILSSAEGDFFRVNTGALPLHQEVDITAGGSDRIVLNDNLAVFSGFDARTTVLGFKGGAVDAGGDVLQVQRQTNSLSSSGFELIVAADTDVGAGNRTLVIRSDVFMMDDTWSNGDAQTAFGFATDVIAAGNYTGAVYFEGDGKSGYYIMGFTTAANDAGAATFDLIGVLSSTAVNTLTAANFT